jgi:hypothetical protein
MGNKGRRFVIINANGKEGWCGESMVFEAKSNSSDYHDNMIAEIFEEWFRRLCEKLHEDRDGQKVVFHMDNAAGFGFQILWLPPYHPALNPIEEAWGITKGYVASRNNVSKFLGVRELVLEGSMKVTPEIWSELVCRTYKNEDNFIEKFHARAMADINSFIMDLEEEDDVVDEEDLEGVFFDDIIEVSDDDGVFLDDDEVLADRKRMVRKLEYFGNWDGEK